MNKTPTVLLLLAGALSGAVAARGETAQALQEQALRLAHGNACRRAEAELAEEGRFYLVLDTEQRSLSLKLRGALLREVRLDAVEIGRPHRFLFERDTRNRVRGRVHRHARLAPRRPLLRLPVEISESSDEATQTIMLPPEPETAISVPRRYFVRYEGGVALEFRTAESRRDWRQRLADGLSALFGRPELRLRLILDRAAAESFYRSVPLETDLLVL